MVTPGHLTVFDISNNPKLYFDKDLKELCYLGMPKSLYYERLNDTVASFDLYEYYTKIDSNVEFADYWMEQPGVKEYIKKEGIYLSQA